MRETFPEFEMVWFSPTRELCRLQQHKYVGTHHMALVLQTEVEGAPGVFDPHGAALSVNVPESSRLPEDAFYAKHWAEMEGVPEALVDAGILEKLQDVKTASSGFVSDITAYRLTKAYKAGDISTVVQVKREDT